MKRYKLINSALMGLILVSVVSCKKFLDKKYSNSLVIPESVEDLQKILDDPTRMNTTMTPALGTASSDDYFLPQNLFDGISDQKDKDFYLWQLPTYMYPNDWAKGYGMVYNANYCLEMLEKNIRTAQNGEAWDNVKGSALFFRAYSFLNLTWNYAKAFDENTSATDLGICLRLTSDFNKRSVRANVKDSYEQVINDAKESVSYLPISSLHPYRPSRTAAYGLLARAFLSMRRYDEAFKYADSSLRFRNDLIDLKVNNTSDFGTPSATFPFKAFNKEVIFHTEMYTQWINNLFTVSRARIDTALYATFAATDIRKTAFFNPNPPSPYFNFKGSYFGSAIPFSGIATDEMYLTRAECFARAGNKDAAMTDLNAVLIKRHTSAFTPLGAIDAADALNKILLERRKELLFRGLRWMDIKRLNKEGANIVLKRIIGGKTYTLEPNSNRYALPLPTDIISIGGLPQNPQ